MSRQKATLPNRHTMPRSATPSGSDCDGEDLDNTLYNDYSAVSVIDKYEGSMIDDKPKFRPLSSSARRAAEAAMNARDERAAYTIGTNRNMSRLPKAMGQVHANQEGTLEISRLSKHLKISEDVTNKAAEFIRKAYTGIKCFDQTAKECLPAACLEIASQVCKRPLRREQMLKHSDIKQKEYGRTLSMLHAQLGIPREISISEICTDFRCQAIKASSRQMLEVFKRLFWASLIEARREHADFSRPVFAIVAVLLTAERNKSVVKVPDRKELMQYAGVSEDDFKFVYLQMSKLCTPSALEAGISSNSSANNAPCASNVSSDITQNAIAKQTSSDSANSTISKTVDPEVICKVADSCNPIPEADTLEASLARDSQKGNSDMCEESAQYVTPVKADDKAHTITSEGVTIPVSAGELSAKATAKKPPPPALPEGRKMTHRSLQRSALISSRHAHTKAPTGCNVVCGDGLPSAAASLQKRKRDTDSENNAAMDKIEYEKWKRSVMATRDSSAAGAPAAPASGSTAVQSSLLGFVKKQGAPTATGQSSQPESSRDGEALPLLPSAAAGESEEAGAVAQPDERALQSGVPAQQEEVPLRERLAAAAERRIGAVIGQAEGSGGLA